MIFLQRPLKVPAPVAESHSAAPGTPARGLAIGTGWRTGMLLLRPTRSMMEIVQEETAENVARRELQR